MPTPSMEDSEWTTVVSRCPVCGKPRPLADAALVVRCRACDSECPVEPELARAAGAYRTARQNAPLQFRQKAHIEALLAEAERATQRARLACIRFFGPALVLLLIGLRLRSFSSDDTDRTLAAYAPALIAPLPVVVVTGALAWAIAARKRIGIQVLLSARPMKDAPGTLACSVCGGPVAAKTEKNAVVACAYCGTPNMIGPAVSRAAARLALEDYEARAEALLRRSSFDLGGLLAKIAVPLPLLVLVVLLVWAWRGNTQRTRERRSPDRAAVYVKVHCPGSPNACIHKPDVSIQEACYGRTPVVTAIRVADLEGATVVSTGCAWSRPVEFPESLTDLKVTTAFSDGFGRNHVRVEGAFGVSGECLVEGVCVADPHEGR